MPKKVNCIRTVCLVPVFRILCELQQKLRRITVLQFANFFHQDSCFRCTRPMNYPQFQTITSLFQPNKMLSFQSNQNWSRHQRVCEVMLHMTEVATFVTNVDYDFFARTANGSVNWNVWLILLRMCADVFDFMRQVSSIVRSSYQVISALSRFVRSDLIEP